MLYDLPIVDWVGDWESTVRSE